MNTMFEVMSGTFDDFQGESVPNLKYNDTFGSFEDAFKAYQDQSSRVWSCLYIGDQLITGCDPFSN